MWTVLFLIVLAITIRQIIEPKTVSLTDRLSLVATMLPELWVLSLFLGVVAVVSAHLWGELHVAVSLFAGGILVPLYTLAKTIRHEAIAGPCPDETRSEKLAKQIVSGFIALTLILTFAAGLLLPPNNWDSMTYHLSRVMFWVQHDNLYYYPTYNVRQLYQPPLAEWMTYLGYKLDLNSDRGLFLIQWLSYASCIALSWQVIRQQIIKPVYQVLALSFAVSIPMAVLQASSTQNDQVLAFLVLYATIRLFKARTWFDFAVVGIAAALAFMTKGTALLMLSGPVLVFLVTRFRSLKFSNISAGLAGLLIGLVLYAPQILQNVKHIGHPLGIDKAESVIYSNESYAPNLLLNNLMRNLGMHISGPGITKLSTDVQTFLIELVTQTDINDTRISFPNLKYEAPYATQEDYATNLIALVFILLSIGASIRHFKSSLTSQLVMSGLVSIVVFSFLIKWQVWHSRLHLPIFWLATPSAVMLVLSKYKPNRIAVISFLVLLSGLGIFFALKNDRRQLGNPKHWAATGWDSYYAADRDDQLNDWHSIKEYIASQKPKSLGLYMNGDQWDYPITKWLNDQGIRFSPCYPELNKERLTWQIKPLNLYEDSINNSTTPDLYLVDLSVIKDREQIRSSTVFFGTHFALLKASRHPQN